MSRWARIPKAALLAVVLIVATEVLFLSQTEPLTGLPYLEPTADDAILVAKQTLIPRAAGRLVLVGDSSCTMGLMPSVIEEETGIPTVNLGTISSMTFVGFTDLTERACSQNPPPKGVVLAVLPRSFEVTEHDAHEFRLVGRYLTATHRKSPHFTPSMRDRWEWFARKHHFNIFPQEFGGSYAKYEQILSDSNGWFLEDGQYVLKPKDMRDQFHPRSFAQEGFTQLISTCRAKQIPVLFWWSPSPSDALTPEYVAQVTQFTQQLQQTTPQLDVPRATVPLWEPNQFSTVTHVNAEGAKRNSHELATTLRQRGWK